MLAFLEPFIQAEFAKAKAEGRREPRGAYVFDALLAASRPPAGGTGTGRGRRCRSSPESTSPPSSAAAPSPGRSATSKASAPSPSHALLELLPQAAIDLVVTNGEDIFNVTHLGRKTTVRQQVVLHWLGVECARLGCSATRHLEIDHRIDWAHTHVTELKALDWLCPPRPPPQDHRRLGAGPRPRQTPDGPTRRPPPPRQLAHPEHAAA